MYRATRKQSEEQGGSVPMSLLSRREDSPSFSNPSPSPFVGPSANAPASLLSRSVPPEQPPLEKQAGIAETAGPLDMWQIFRWLWAGRVLIILFLIIGIVAAFAASRLLTPRFTTYTDLMINPSQLQLTSDDLYNVNAQREAQLLNVASKLRMLTSTNVLSRVVSALSLAEDEEFASAAAPQEAQLEALRSLYERIEVLRDGQSYVATIAVWSQDPMKAITISDALVDSFKTEIAVADAENSARAAAAMTERLDTLRLRANAAAAAVEEFRRDNQLEDIGGELLSTQSLSQLNEQINATRERLLQAEARYSATRALQAGAPASAETAASPVLGLLRERHANLEEQLQSRLVVYGPRHPTVAMLQSAVASARQAVDEEIERMIEIARSQIEQTQAVLDQQIEQLSANREVASQDNEALVRLRELEREAEVQTAIFRSYLQRTAEISESSHVDATDIRVISYPVPPETRNWPPRLLYLLMAGLVAGGGIGAVIALLAGLMRRYGPELRQRITPLQQ